MARLQNKLFEVRDGDAAYATLATLAEPDDVPNPEDRILARGGAIRGGLYFTWLNRATTQSDPTAWPAHRPFGYAHAYVKLRWEEMQSGDVIDLDYLLGERPTPRPSSWSSPLSYGCSGMPT